MAPLVNLLQKKESMLFGRGGNAVVAVTQVEHLSADQYLVTRPGVQECALKRHTVLGSGNEHVRTVSRPSVPDVLICTPAPRVHIHAKKVEARVMAKEMLRMDGTQVAAARRKP